MIAQWLTPLLEWTGLTLIELLVLAILVVVVIKLVKGD